MNKYLMVEILKIIDINTTLNIHYLLELFEFAVFKLRIVSENRLFSLWNYSGTVFLLRFIHLDDFYLLTDF